MEARAFKQGKGSGHTQANAKTGGNSKSTPPGRGIKNNGGDGHAINGDAASKPAHHKAYQNSNGTGSAMHGPGPSKGPNHGSHKQGSGTGHALHEGEGEHKKEPGEKGESGGTGTGHVLRGKVGPNKRAAHGGHSDATARRGSGKMGSAAKITDSKQPSPYGVHDGSRPKELPRHYAKDASPLGIKSVADIQSYAKKKHGIGSSR